MLLAVALQIAGAVCVVAAAFLWFGVAAALCASGAFLLAGGLAHERGA